MFYRLLGIVVWRLGKLFLRRRYGAAMVPKPLLAATALLPIVAGAAAARQRRRSHSD